MPWSVPIRDVAQDYAADGIPGLQTVDNPTANPPTRANLDRGLAVGQRAIGQTPGVQFAVIDTSGTGGLTPTQALKRANPGAF